jgi:hypothetical protein
MTTLLPGQILGFPLIYGRVVGRGNPDAPQEGTAMPTSVTTSVSATRQGFLPSPKKHIPGHSVTLRQPRRPPTRATTVLQPSPPSHCGPLTKTNETERRQPKPRGAWTAATQEGTTSTATCSDRPDAATGADQAPLARPSPMATLQSTRRRPSHPQQENLHQPPGAGTEMPDLARPSPDGAQIWARTAPPLASVPPRRQVAAPSPPRHPAPPPPGRSAAATGTLSTEEHHRQHRETPRRLPRARVGAGPPPPAPHGTLPGGLRRRRRREERGRRRLAALGLEVTRPRPRGTGWTKRFGPSSSRYRP